MIDPDTMQAWAESDQRRAAGARSETMALEVRLRSLFVGELEARVVVAVRDAVAPIMRDVEALRVEVERLSAMHPKVRS